MNTLKKELKTMILIQKMIPKMIMIEQPKVKLVIKWAAGWKVIVMFLRPEVGINKWQKLYIGEMI
jgi:hypothetical protein